MKKFLINILLFGISLLVVDKLLIFVRDKGPELEVDTRLEKIITGEIDADILIYGSSRGARSVAAYQIEDSLNRSCYNLSFPGSNILFHEYLLRSTLETKGNTKPSIVVLVVDDGDEFKNAKSMKFRFDRMYPLVKYGSIRDEMVRRNEKKWGFNELLVSHQINRSHFLFEQKKFTRRDSILPCGSMLLGHQKKNFDYKYKVKPYTYTKQGEMIQKLRAFDQFVALCKKNNIELLIAITPNFRPATDGFKERLEQRLDGYGTVFEFDPNIKEYKNKDYFFDNAHLQRNGANIYTAELVEAIENL